MSHVLDNPVWHSLVGDQRPLVEGDSLALRLPADIAPFSALPDEPTPEAWDALARLFGPAGVAVLFRDQVAVPDGWESIFSMPVVQMVATDVAPAACPDARLLNANDVAEMIALVRATRPGPFAVRTIELGDYLGWHEDARLVAMAGERLRPPGYVEISAVCTADTHRRRGLAEVLIRDLVGRIRDRGTIPMLHVAADNEPAIALYEKMGFRRRRLIEAVGVRVAER